MSGHRRSTSTVGDSIHAPEKIVLRWRTRSGDDQFIVAVSHDELVAVPVCNDIFNAPADCKVDGKSESRESQIRLLPGASDPGDMVFT